ncbi:uncharacterized protein [Amphiura filiformis]|uniref:uncharacterized protein n=1 Tax=Amphiura filiformis TaxID=82378 RepID=UPI003B20ECC9
MADYINPDHHLARQIRLYIITCHWFTSSSIMIYRAGPMFFNDDDLSSPPVLKAFNMSPVGNLSSSVGYALTEAPLDTSISEAESAVSCLLNETFESFQSESPEPPSMWQRQQSFDLESGSQSDQFQSSSTSGPSSSDGTSSCSTSGTSGSSFSSSSDPPSFYHTSSSSVNSSGQFSSSVGLSRSGGSFSSSSASGFSRSGPFSSSASSGHSMPTSSFGVVSRSDGMLLPPPMPSTSSHGKDIISSAFLNATQEQAPPGSMSRQESSMMEVQMPLMDEEQLAVPLPPSPVEFTTGLMHAASSTPIVNMARPICTVPNCQCQFAPRQPRFIPSSQPMPIFNVQGVPMKLEPC